MTPYESTAVVSGDKNIKGLDKTGRNEFSKTYDSLWNVVENLTEMALKLSISFTCFSPQTIAKAS